MCPKISLERIVQEPGNLCTYLDRNKAAISQWEQLEAMLVDAAPTAVIRLVVI